MTHGGVGSDPVRPVAKRRKWMIEVLLRGEGTAYLRHGSRIGAGKIVQFTSKPTADANADFVLIGLDAGSTAHVVPYDKSCE